MSKKKLAGPRAQLSALKLEQARTAIGMPKAELARRIGTTRQTIFNWCEGGLRDVEAGVLEKLCKELRCREKDLLVMVR
jgi:DNA-binding Xre family transcriptional regulator